jgi:hypothetical protein
VQPGDDILRRSGGQQQSVPGVRRITRHDLADRRDLGIALRALAAGEPDRLEAAVLDERLQRQQPVHGELHLAGEHVLARLRASLVRHVHHVDSGHGEEERHVEVRGRARSCRAVVELARVLLRVVDELLQVLHRHRRVRHDDLVRVRHHGDRLEVLERVVGLLRLVQRGVDDVGRAHHQDGVAVGRRGRDELGADETAGTGLVVHHDRLSEDLRHLLTHRASERVAGAADGERHDQLDGLVGVLRGSRHKNGGEQRGAERQGDAMHPVSFVQLSGRARERVRCF